MTDNVIRFPGYLDLGTLAAERTCTARIHFAGPRQPSSTKKRGIFAQSNSS